MTSRILAAVNVYPLKTMYQPSYMNNTNLCEMSSREIVFKKKNKKTKKQKEQTGISRNCPR